MTLAPPLLCVTNLSKAYRRGTSEPVDAVAGVCLVLPKGRFLALKGPSGCGKSTLLSLLGTLETPDSGSVDLLGRNVTTLAPRDRAVVRRRDIGFVFQDLNLLATLSAVENVALPLELDGAERSSARAAAMTQLELLGIDALAERVPSEMSGGQRQRVAVARATIGSRKLILADEPCGSLDSEAGATVLTSLRLAADSGLGVIMVTHNNSDAGWADGVLHMDAGRIL